VRTAALTTVIAAAALVATACSSPQTGQASPTSDQPSASSASSPSSSGATSSLAGLKACTLLSDNEAQQVAPGADAHEDHGQLGGTGTSNCQWNTHATNDSGGVTFSITVRPSQGLSDINLKAGASRSDTTSTSGRQVVLVKNNGAGISCFAAIAVGSGRVDINATTLRDATTEQMCSIVSKIDDYVEPRLPA
jgi:uncharacterized protein DUF3558